LNNRLVNQKLAYSILSFHANVWMEDIGIHSSSFDRLSKSHQQILQKLWWYVFITYHFNSWRLHFI